MSALMVSPGLTWANLAYAAIACWVVYATGLAVYRLWLSPIAHLPGPKLAALTQYYEFFYDIILGGQYTFKIVEMHKKYGPVVRISPWEVHVGDHDFHAELYTGPHRRRHKWSFWAKQVSCGWWLGRMAANDDVSSLVLPVCTQGHSSSCRIKI